MNPLIQKLITFERQLSREKGPFTLFCLFRKHDFPAGWDVVISAPWLPEHQMKSIRFIVARLKKVLLTREMLQLSGVRILHASHPLVREITDAFHLEHGDEELANCEFGGVELRRAHIITSMPSSPRAAKKDVPVGT
jgi:hypothetical protein